MRVALDYDTVVAQNPQVWLSVAHLLAGAGYTTTVVASPETAAQADRWSLLGGINFKVCLENQQKQDVYGADIWIDGRPDRVIGVEQIHSLYTMLNQA